MAAETRTNWRIAGIINLDRYPIHDLRAGEGKRLVERCRTELAARGACQVDALIQPAAVRAVLEDAKALSHRTFRTEATHNHYFEEDEGVAANDPRRTHVRSAKRALGWS
jgi:hypothetical protein